ncbi:ribonucleotide reductase [Cutibacterium acnes JCM 18920]|nr:ribonucleotide reductase [Cutibacterium acnes JCM 18920]
MTETKSAPRRTSRSKGLHVERIFSTEGVHPYDEVTWERRDVVQTNWRTGDVVFEQRGVEFPDFWSVNASTIVTNKYFRGALGTPAREDSLKTLIDRVVNTYVTTGRKNGYFASDDDAKVFGEELTWLLVHQYFSFNSPVWFNVGTTSPQQVSACFILSVDDSMESILNWYREEGFIFKGGSGAGLNISRIRSSKELLSSGGTASGPVSFMRGADASAGTIKSGGATRRAARWSSLTSITPISKSSSRPRRARRTRFVLCAMPGSTWTWAGATSSAFSIRTPTTRCVSPRSWPLLSRVSPSV